MLHQEIRRIDPVQERSGTSDMVWIPGGTFRMGSDHHYPEEAPAHRVSVDGFWIDPTPVTNRQFKQFVKATGYKTTAEIAPDPKDYPGALPDMLYAGSLVFIRPPSTFDPRDWSPWCTCPARMRWPTRNGRARICRPKLSGNSRPAEALTVPSSPGATSSRPVACTWPTPGRARFRCTTFTSTATAAPRRWKPSHLMATVF